MNNETPENINLPIEISEFESMNGIESDLNNVESVHSSFLQHGDSNLSTDLSREHAHSFQKRLKEHRLIGIVLFLIGAILGFAVFTIYVSSFDFQDRKRKHHEFVKFAFRNTLFFIVLLTFLVMGCFEDTIMNHRIRGIESRYFFYLAIAFIYVILYVTISSYLINTL